MGLFSSQHLQPGDVGNPPERPWVSRFIEGRGHRAALSSRPLFPIS